MTDQYTEAQISGNNQIRVSLGMTPHIHGGPWTHEDGVFCGPRHGDVLETGWGFHMVYLDLNVQLNTPENNSESHHEQPKPTEE